MRMVFLLVAAIVVQLGSVQMARAQEGKAMELKQQILKLAQSYQGQGDPDQSKQKTLEPLVAQLVAESPMPPVKDRLALLAGPWKQVWGPYEYRHDDGTVDPKLGVNEIYQVIFPGGYYYNVAPYYPKGDHSREQVGLLRGEFRPDPDEPNTLRVHFTKYPGVEPRPQRTDIWNLAADAEADHLENKISIVPTLIVRLFFGGGKLEEVYTDQDVRILYGKKDGARARKFLYVMTRAR